MKKVFSWPLMMSVLVVIVIVLSIQNYSIHKTLGNEREQTISLSQYEETIEYYKQELEHCETKMKEYRSEVIKYEGMDWELYNGLNINTLDRIYTSAERNGGLYAVNHPIEMEYIYDRPDGDSTREMMEWTEQYRVRWEEEAEKYEKLITSYEQEDIQELFAVYNQARKEYMDSEKLFFSELYDLRHEKGSLSSLITLNTYVKIEREHALALIKLYGILYGENRPIEW